MSLLTIIVYSDGNEIGRCNYTSLEEIAFKTARNFTFRAFKVKTPTIISNSGYEWINFSIYMKTRFGKTREISKLKILPRQEVNFNRNGDIKVHGHVIPDRITDNYNQHEIDVLHSWSQDCEINWQSPMVSREQKEALLSVRARYWGYSHSLEKERGELNGNTIYHYEDFFLSLGELINEERGFIGSCYNSLHDCLIDCFPQKTNPFSLRVIHSDQIKEVLGIKYFNDIIKLLEQYNFKIELE